MAKRSKSDLDPTQGPAIHCAHTDFLPLDALKPHPRNPNHHPDSQIALLATIIAEQGWRAPITVSTRSGYVVRGHGRLMAARKLGLAGAPVDRQPYPSDAAELADLVADNRIAELAGMDAAAVRAICDELAAADFDTALAGFPDFGPVDGPGYHFAGGSTPFDGPGDDTFDVNPATPPDLRSGDRAPFQQMTFTLHDEQVSLVNDALTRAKRAGLGKGTLNANSNGNALAAICEHFHG
jgi:hypothetical protein